MPIEQVAFGRMYRYRCDKPGCEERQTVRDGDDAPDGWTGDGDEAVFCPSHGSVLVVGGEP